MFDDAHVDVETLSLIALGEPEGSPSDRVHLSGCDRCTADLVALRHAVAVGRSVSADDQPADPPAGVWDRVQAELDADETAGVATVTPLVTSRRWSSWLLAAASVLSLVVGVTAGVLLASGGGDAPPPSAASPSAPVVATAALTALPQHAGSGKAQIVRTPQGKQLVVDVSNLTRDPGGFYEVWLIDPKTFQMVGLGALDGADGTFAIPKGLDLSTYRVVDVSIEPMDGNPVHSGNSVVRGTLAL